MGSGGEYPWKSSALLITSYLGYMTATWLITGDVSLDHLVKAVSAAHTTIKLFFHVHTLFYRNEPLNPVKGWVFRCGGFGKRAVDEALLPGERSISEGFWSKHYFKKIELVRCTRREETVGKWSVTKFKAWEMRTSTKAETLVKLMSKKDCGSERNLLIGNEGKAKKPRDILRFWS